ncbi:MAG: hydrogenase maturation nickel metallochaperone HypA [Roseiarcus sp.]
MHEATVAAGVLSILVARAAEHGIVRIDVVRLKIGRLRGLDSRQVRGGFEMFAEGTIAEGARVEIDEVAAEALCRTCGTNWKLPNYRFECPSCGGSDADVVKGRELYVESFDGRRDDDAHPDD